MTAPRRQRPGWRARRAGYEGRSNYPWIVFGTALAGLISANFLVSVLGAAVDGLSEELAVDASLMQWVVTGPNLGFAVFAITAGKLADLFGRQ